MLYLVLMPLQGPLGFHKKDGLNGWTAHWVGNGTLREQHMAASEACYRQPRCWTLGHGGGRVAKGGHNRGDMLDQPSLDATLMVEIQGAMEVAGVVGHLVGCQLVYLSKHDCHTW